MTIKDYEDLISKIITNPDDMSNFNALKESINNDINSLEQKELKIKELRQQNADLFLKTSQGKKQTIIEQPKEETVLSPKDKFKLLFSEKYSKLGGNA